jgi:hypothetical protein
MHRRTGNHSCTTLGATCSDDVSRLDWNAEWGLFGLLTSLLKPLNNPTVARTRVFYFKAGAVGKSKFRSMDNVTTEVRFKIFKLDF